jgi:xanthine/uracil/vitamin C permease (AzgA family)
VRASLGRVTFWATLVALGLLAVVDASGVSISASAYVAVALAVVGAALIVGFLYGRARGLIVVGAVLAVLLGIVAGAEHVGTNGQDVTWSPATVAQVDASYGIDIGDATLDLSAVDFTGRSVSVTVHVAMGNLTVVLPSTVDARTLARVNVGDAEVFGQEWSGIGQSEHVVTDLGTDGVGGGNLTLRATVDVGNLEVRR